ncbi:MAG TPA: HD domain-containing phosphohydrolase [Candidatus Eremiobacteraceae bacterium]|nr:HD domain-containing phosphohydrolase [Candidatus Eremiobacteraceae bacterium]
MALASDQAQVESDKWRHVALDLYCYAVGLAGFALIALFPPHLDLRPLTIASVAIVAVFLATTERPIQSAGKSFAPLTAVVAASTIVFGAWTLVPVLVSVIAVRLRGRPDLSPAKVLFSSASSGQAGTSVIATYGMLATWSIVSHLQTLAPSWAAIPVAFAGILSVGLTWQIVQHGLAYFYYALYGMPVNTLQFVRVGVLASLYGYLLVALYSFGGLLAPALFYVLVMRGRVVQDLTGVTRSLNQLEHARGQATSLVRELIRFTDVPGVQFTGEVQNIAEMLARHIGMSRLEVHQIGLAAELHEIGMCRLPARLRRGERLNATEEAQRKTYSRLGALMLRNVDAVVEPAIADFIESHTERFDGAGYPKGLSGEAIPMPSRIIAIARGYVCMLTGYDRTRRVQKEEALRVLREESGTLYDPRLVDLLADLVA